MNTRILSQLVLIAVLCGLPACSNWPDMGTGYKAYQAQEYEKAFWHYNELSEFGIPRAKIELGKLYLYGRGTERDPEKALALFKEAGAEGERKRAAMYIPRAQAKLGQYILKDKVKGYTDEEAIALLEEAAAADNRDGYFELGYAYEKGLGVAPDGEKAAHYYHKSAEKGYSRGAFYEGQLYFEGDLVTQNIPKAIELYEQAAESGYPRAYLELGQIYEKGEGVPQDYQKAEEYYRLAQAEGEMASKHLERLQKYAAPPP